MNSSQRNTLVRVKLLAERNNGTADKSLRQKDMGQCVSVVRKHEYFLEVTSSTYSEFKDVFFRFENDAIQVIDSISDSNCR
jgi:hypothetical protein